MNNNAMLLHDNSVDRAVVSASSEVVTMPVSNLQNQQRTEMWRSAATGSQVIDITLAAGEAQVQAFALVDHNLTLAGTVQIEAWNDALGGVDQVLDSTLQPYQPVYGFGDELFGEGLFGGYDIYIGGLSIADARSVLRPILMLQIAPSLSARFWRITISDPVVTDYYQAGRIYLGPAWQPTVNFSWGSTKVRENRTRRKESRGGQYYGNKRVGRTILKFDLNWLINSDSDRLWITNMLLGNDTPFILVQRPVGGYEQESTTYYGVFEQLSLQQVFQGNSKAPLEFREVL